MLRRKANLVLSFFLLLPLLGTSQSINEISEKFWEAVKDKNYEVQIRYGPKIVEYFDENEFPVDSTYLDFLFILGNAYYSLDDFENSKLIHIKSIKYCEGYYNSGDFRTLMHKYALVNDLQQLRSYDEVIVLAKTCLEGFDNHLGFENDYSILMQQLISTSYEFKNDLDSAAYYSSSRISRALNLHGEVSDSYVLSIFDLARIKKNQNHFSEAILLYEKCIMLSPLVFNKYHYTYEASLFNIGEIHYQLGEYIKSIELNQECLALQKEIYGEHSINYVKTLNNLANCYSGLGDYSKSLSYNQESFIICKELFGNQHNQTWISMNNIALNHSLIGQWETSKSINLELVYFKRQSLTENSYSYIQSLSNLSVDYSNLSDNDSSFYYSMQCLKLLELNNFHNTELYATVTQNIAFHYLKLGELDQSEFYIQLSLETTKSILGVNSLSYMGSLGVLMSIYERQGKNDMAFEGLNLIHNYKIENYGLESFLYAKSLSIIASFYNQIGYYDKAVDSLQKALPIYIKTLGENHILTLQEMSFLALYLSNQGNLKEALKINLTVLTKRGKFLSLDHNDYVTSLINTASNYSDLRDFQKSKELNIAAINIQEKKLSRLNPYLYATALSNYGSLLLEIGKTDSSLFFLNKSLQFTSQNIGVKSEDYIIKLNNIGNFYQTTSNLSLAKSYFDSAYTIAVQLFGADHPRTIQCYENLASTFAELGNYSKAIEIEYDCLERIINRLGDENLEFAFGLHQLAYYYSKMEIDTAAREMNQLAYEIRKEILGPKHPETILSASNLAQDYSNLKDFDNALKILKQVLASQIEIEGEGSLKTKLTYNNVGMLYFDLEDYNRALEYLKNAYEEGDDFKNVGVVLVNTSYVYESLDDMPNAIYYQEKAVDYYLKDYLKNQLFLSESQKLKYKIKLDYFVNYLIYLNNKDNFSGMDYSWYHYYINSKNLVNIKNKLENLDVSDSEKQNIRSIHDKINNLRAEIIRISEMNEKSSLSDIEIELEKIEITYSSLIGGKATNLINTKSIQSELQENQSIFIDIIPFRDTLQTQNAYMAVIVEKNSVSSVKMESFTNLANDIESQYVKETSDPLSITDLKSGIFYDNIWKPIANKIGDVKTIYISLAGVYNNINLNTIYNPETEKYLIEEKDIRIVNSARDFVLSMEDEKDKYTNNTASLFGYPNFDGNNTVSTDTLDLFASSRNLNSFWLDSLTRGGMKANPLPATKTEVENISSALKSKGWHVTSFLEDNASETNIKKQQSPRILHVATHGYFFEDIPMEKDNNHFLGMNREQVVEDPMLRSGLLFTGANKTLKGELTNGENGLLSAAEASLLDLRETELVVLSACETGKGEITISEGIFGLRKAFSDAGAQNIIMSLWKVDDKVTQEFMTRFYEIWLNDKTTIREAFNKTQLEIMAKYPQPYYWGAFVLIGD